MTNRTIEPQTFLFAGGRYEFLLTAGETLGRYSLLLVTEPPGNATPVHRHESDWETAYVLSGALQVETRGQAQMVRAGQLCVLPPGNAHRLGNPETSDARYVLLCAPNQFEGFVRELGAPVADPATPPRPMQEAEIGQLVEAAGRFGVELLDDNAWIETGRPVTPSETCDIADSSTVEIIAEYGAADDDIALLLETVPPGAVIPLQRHREFESFCVIEGELEIWLEDGRGWRTLGAGQVQHVPANFIHQLRNSGSKPFRALVVTEKRMASFFREAAEPAGSQCSDSETLKRFQTAVAKYGHQLQPTD